MDEFIESIKNKMTKDKEKIISQKNIEDLYVLELADKWIDINVKSKEEYIQKLEALGEILKNKDFQKAIKISALAMDEKNSDEKVKEIAELITKIRKTDEYKENSRISGYKILSKYENPNVLKTDSFIVHTNIMMKLFEYLKEKEELHKI